MQRNLGRKGQHSYDRYEKARIAAQRKRTEINIRTEDFDIPLLKKICRDEGIKVDLVKTIGNRIRAAYFSDECGCAILLRKNLPREPKMFALAHELKHHLLDREIIESGQIKCGDYNANKEIEVAAEVFAAEFLFPEDEMRDFLAKMGIARESCTQDDVVKIKRGSPVPISYTFICKRLVWFDILDKDEFKDVRFQKLEEELYPPIYKQDWYKRYRARKKLR